MTDSGRSTRLHTRNLTRTQAVHALWNDSRPAVFFTARGLPAPDFDAEEASRLVRGGDSVFVDYCCGRLIKTRFHGDGTVDATYYDLEYGQGAAARALAKAQ